MCQKENVRQTPMAPFEAGGCTCTAAPAPLHLHRCTAAPAPLHLHRCTCTAHRRRGRRPPRHARERATPATPASYDGRYDLNGPIDNAVFPGHQGGPHNHTICALATALKQAQTPEFVFPEPSLNLP